MMNDDNDDAADNNVAKHSKAKLSIKGGKK